MHSRSINNYNDVIMNETFLQIFLLQECLIPPLTPFLNCPASCHATLPQELL